jgi:hypothetical protein
VQLDNVTAILYPGQERGGDFKPHGGFRFDSLTNEEVTVVAPLDGRLVGSSRYLEQGEVQYLLDFETECGVAYRFDHLLVLSPKLAEAVASLPEPQADDSRTTPLQGTSVAQGEVIATAVGLQNSSNVFVDFGVYDSNENPQPFQSLRENAMCWFDLLSPEDATLVRSLPAGDSVSGKTSEYCQ